MAPIFSSEVVLRMNSLVAPGLDTLRQWLDELGISFFECDTCQALHLPHMQNFDGVFDAKIDLINDVVLFTAMAEVKPSALLALAADLSAINASSLTVKAFLDIQDDNLPKLVVCQTLSSGAGVTLEQFAWFMRQSEEQISMVILEARAHQMLFVPEEEELKAGEDAYNFLH
jgi:hypothetical protein